MKAPSIVWRNPHWHPKRRAWTRLKRDVTRSLYLVAESASAQQNEWKGLTNLEVIQGGAVRLARVAPQSQTLPSGA